MGMKDEILTERINMGGTCYVQNAIYQLQELGRDAHEFLEIIENPSIPASAIARWLNKQDISVNAASLTRHRRGECRCGNK